MTRSDRNLSTTEREFRASLLDWGQSNVREYPWREPERSLYEVFVAEFFLTQTPADNVASVYPDFLERFPSLGAIEESSEDELVDVIEPLGFYNMRASALMEIAGRVENIPRRSGRTRGVTTGGQVRGERDCLFCPVSPPPVLDRNVERIYGRVFGEEWPESKRDQAEFASELVLEDQPRLYNFSLLDFGAAICQSTPDCDSCFASEYCHYYRESV